MLVNKDTMLWFDREVQFNISLVYHALICNDEFPNFCWNKRIWLKHNNERENLFLWKDINNAPHTKSNLAIKGF